MLKRIYIDNYKSLVNFDQEFGSINLLMGINGAGKTTIFNVLHTLHLFAQAEIVLEELFPRDTLTRWSSSNIQSFRLSIENAGALYEYELGIEHGRGDHAIRIQYERLKINGEPLLNYAQNVLEYYVSDSIIPLKVENIRFSRTTLESIPDDDNTARLIWFRKRMSRFLIVQIDPLSMVHESPKSESTLSRHAENFVSWYRYITQDTEKMAQINQELSEVFDDFRDFNLSKMGEHVRGLEANFQQNGQMLAYRFSELSEGQRTLAVLYTLIIYAHSRDYTICIDEPGNYLALQEIQPWIVQLSDLCDDGLLQAIVISHHPELINYLVFSNAGIWFSREDNTSATKSMPLPQQNGSSLPIAELIARGWIDE